MDLSRISSLRTHARDRLRAGGVLLADLIVPRRCGLCGTFGVFLCERCAGALPAAAGTACPGCAVAATASGLCPTCAGGGAPPLASIVPAYSFEAGARRLVHRLKYERLSALAAPMGTLMAARPALRTRVSGTDGAPAVDLIAPTPLHRQRERERGFNQCALLAAELGRAFGIPVRPRAMVRVRNTRPQVRTTSAAERRANVAGAFAVREDVRGRIVLLVDDVATTGATLRACADALRAAGAARVDAAVFALDGSPPARVPAVQAR